MDRLEAALELTKLMRAEGVYAGDKNNSTLANFEASYGLVEKLTKGGAVLSISEEALNA